jgi:hypothetical protein
LVAASLPKFCPLANVRYWHLAEHYRAGASYFAAITNVAPFAGRHVLAKGNRAMSLGTILIIILVIALLGGFSGLGGGPFYGTGYYGGGGLGVVLVVVLILVLLGRL